MSVVQNVVLVKLSYYVFEREKCFLFNTLFPIEKKNIWLNSQYKFLWPFWVHGEEKKSTSSLWLRGNFIESQCSKFRKDFSDLLFWHKHLAE